MRRKRANGGGSAARVRTEPQPRRDGVTRLLPRDYQRLRRPAARFLAGERCNHTLGVTALAHEAYVRLVGSNGREWTDRAHSCGVRPMLIDRPPVITRDGEPKLVDLGSPSCMTWKAARAQQRSIPG